MPCKSNGNCHLTSAGLSKCSRGSVRAKAMAALPAVVLK